MKEMPFGFTTMPRWSTLLPVSQLARTLLHLYAEFASVSQGYVAWVTDARAALLLNISERYVKRGKAELKAQKFISVSRGAPGVASQININWNTVAQVGAAIALSKGLKILELEPIIEEVEGTMVQGRSALEFPIEVNQGAHLGGTIVPTNKSNITRDLEHTPVGSVGEATDRDIALGSKANGLAQIANRFLRWWYGEYAKQNDGEPPLWDKAMWPRANKVVCSWLKGFADPIERCLDLGLAAQWALQEHEASRPREWIEDLAADPFAFLRPKWVNKCLKEARDDGWGRPELLAQMLRESCP